jgi:hypothetical protein
MAAVLRFLRLGCYLMLVAIEEGLETTGIVVFLYSLMKCMAAERISVRILFFQELAAPEPLIETDGRKPDERQEVSTRQTA